jgi:hypothetical protein
MLKRHQDKAAHVVEAFKNTLDIETLQQISDAQFKGLEMMVAEAMGEEMGVAAEMLSEVVAKLRAESERPDLDL